MPKILVAACFQETNSFNPRPTDYTDFTIYRGQALFAGHVAEIDGACKVFATRDNLELVPTYGARMGAGGTITADCWAQISRELIESVEAQRAGVEAVYLALHGAMAAEGEPDPEGYLLQEIKARLGDHVPVVVSLDMHGTITRRMLSHMDGAAILHTYPHIDWFQMGERAATQVLQILDGAQPVVACSYIPTMVRGDELKTATGVFGTFIRHCQRLEARSDVLGAGVMLGHPFTDAPEQSSQVLVITDNDPELAGAETTQLAADFWAMRRHMQPVLYDLTTAITIAQAVTGAVVFADAADATSSGAAGDSNVILDALLRQGYAGKVLFPIRDAPAVEAAFAGGVGSRLTLSLGGTVDARFTPLEVTVEVVLLSNGNYVNEGGMVRAAGPLAVLQAGNITIVASTRPAPLNDYAMYFGIGLDPKRFDLIVVKLPHTPHYQYEAWAARVLTVDVPGAAAPNVKRLSHRLVTRPIYPLDEAPPFSAEAHVLTRRRYAAG